MPAQRNRVAIEQRRNTSSPAPVSRREMRATARREESV